MAAPERALPKAPSHTAQKQAFEVMVRYPHHPLAGKTITAARRVTYGGASHFHVCGPDHHGLLLPGWMTEPSAAALPVVDMPRLPLDALRALRGLIDAQPSALPFVTNRMRGDKNDAKSTIPASRPLDTCGGSELQQTSQSVRPIGAHTSAQASCHRMRSSQGKCQGSRK